VEPEASQAAQNALFSSCRFPIQKEIAWLEKTC
jgi:hypothetical protein